MKALNDVMIASLKKNDDYKTTYSSILENIDKYFNIKNEEKKVTEKDMLLGIEFLKE